MAKPNTQFPRMPNHECSSWSAHQSNASVPAERQLEYPGRRPRFGRCIKRYAGLSLRGLWNAMVLRCASCVLFAVWVIAAGSPGASAQGIATGSDSPAAVVVFTDPG